MIPVMKIEETIDGIEYVTATEAIDHLGWRRKYFYQVLSGYEESSIDLNIIRRKKTVPFKTLIPVKLVLWLKLNHKKNRQGRQTGVKVKK